MARDRLLLHRVRFQRTLRYVNHEYWRGALSERDRGIGEGRSPQAYSYSIAFRVM